MVAAAVKLLLPAPNALSSSESSTSSAERSVQRLNSFIFCANTSPVLERCIANRGSKIRCAELERVTVKRNGFGLESAGCGEVNCRQRKRKRRRRSSGLSFACRRRTDFFPPFFDDDAFVQSPTCISTFIHRATPFDSSTTMSKTCAVRDPKQASIGQFFRPTGTLAAAGASSTSAAPPTPISSTAATLAKAVAQRDANLRSQALNAVVLDLVSQSHEDGMRSCILAFRLHQQHLTRFLF